jgi:serine/threonine protein phosphatase PrpC
MSLTQFNCTTSVAGGQKVTTAVSGGISLNNRLFNGLIKDLNGNGPSDKVTVNQFKLEEGDILILCSDGLHGYLPWDSLTALVPQIEAAQTAEKITQILRNAVNAVDNITILVKRLPRS